MAQPEPQQTKAFGHFRKRLHERYGIVKIHFAEYQALREQIKNGHKNHFVSRSSNTKTWWLVEVQGQQVLGLYCHNSHGFLTCMPLGLLEGAYNGKARKLRYLGLKEVTQNLHKLAQICGFSSQTG